MISLTVWELITITKTLKRQTIVWFIIDLQKKCRYAKMRTGIFRVWKVGTQEEIRGEVPTEKEMSRHESAIRNEKCLQTENK